jgi:pimeloyl-ACP methyl ester carboxylesterase
MLRSCPDRAAGAAADGHGKPEPDPGAAGNERSDLTREGEKLMTYLEWTDHPGLFGAHGFTEQIADLGEIRMNYAVAGEPGKPALLLVPGQTESWWGYEEAMRLLAGRYQAYAVDLRGQGRSTWTPGRYSLDLFGGDLVRFISLVIRRPVIVSGLSSGGVIAAWLAAFAVPGQIRAAVLEDPPLFSSETNPAAGPSIRQAIGDRFEKLHKWLGDQWSIGDTDGLQRDMTSGMPGWMMSALQAAIATGNLPPPPAVNDQMLREYDPEWAEAFSTGRAALTCDHENMLRQVKVPVLLTHHFRITDPQTGNLLGALSDQQAGYARTLIEAGGNTCSYQSFPSMAHSMHGTDPATYAAAISQWTDGLGG